MILRRQVILQNETRLGACGWRRGTLVGQVLSQQPATHNVNQPRDRRIESQRDQKEEYVDTRHKQHPPCTLVARTLRTWQECKGNLHKMRSRVGSERLLQCFLCGVTQVVVCAGRTPQKSERQKQQSTLLAVILGRTKTAEAAGMWSALTVRCAYLPDQH